MKDIRFMLGFGVGIYWNSLLGEQNIMYNSLKEIFICLRNGRLRASKNIGWRILYPVSATGN